MVSRNKKDYFKKSTVLFGIIIFIIISMLIEVILMRKINARSINGTSSVLLNQVVSSLEKNEENEEQLIEELKEEYIVRAKAIAYFLDKGTINEKDIASLRKFASLMRIDEVHLFDENGVLYTGTVPAYYGYSFDSGEQMSYFKPMLTDKSLSMCQDVTPNTAAGRNMMYAITWNASGKRMVQVGIEPKRLIAALNNNRIPNVLDSIPSYEGMDVYVANLDSGEILGSTNESAMGKTLDEVGFSLAGIDLTETYSYTTTIDGYMNYCKFRQSGNDMIVGVVASTETSLQSFIVTMLIEFVYMLIAGAIVFFFVNKWVAAKRAQDEHYAILESMSEIYYSMHLIDLTDDLFVEYNAQNEVKDIADSDKQVGAVEMMQRIMKNVVIDECLEQALEFTDLTTIAERMRNEKVISAELRGKHIGWFMASAIAIDCDDEGKPNRIVFTTRSIDNIKKREESLIRKSFTDELTGCLNRSAYEEDINEYNERPIENNLLYVSSDVNGLKLTNDTLGHAAGDELIKGAAACMKRCFGSNGKVYRTGGDEFVALLYADEKEIENIKKDFEDAISKWSGELVEGMTVSCGYVPRKDAPDSSIRDIAILADKRMYDSKREHYQQKGFDRRNRSYDFAATKNEEA